MKNAPDDATFVCSDMDASKIRCLLTAHAYKLNAGGELRLITSPQKIHVCVCVRVRVCGASVLSLSKSNYDSIDGLFLQQTASQ